MSATTFFRLARPFTLVEIAELTDAEIHNAAVPDSLLGEGRAPPIIIGVAPLDSSRPGDLCFFDNPRYAADLADCRATACFLRDRHVALLPGGVVGLMVADPQRAMSAAMAQLFPEALRPGSLFLANGV